MPPALEVWAAPPGEVTCNAGELVASVAPSTVETLLIFPLSTGHAIVVRAPECKRIVVR